VTVIRSYRDLEVWRRSIKMVVRVYQVVKGFPKAELYGLSDQMKRSAVSIPSNIAEGWGRNYTQEYLRHLAIASGSLAELETQLEIARELEFLAVEEWASITEELTQIGRMLTSLRQSVSRRQDAKDQHEGRVRKRTS